MKKVLVVFMAIVLSGMTGCATKKYVNEQVSRLSIKDQELNAEITSARTDMEENIGKVWKEVGATQEEISSLKETVSKQNEKLNIAEEAMARAETAGKLAKGKLLYEVTMSDESVFFDYKETELSKDAKLALNVFANVLLAENKNVFIEIQGHTDNIGSEEYNLKLGRARAEAVMRYLHMEHNIPLQRMTVFSYGESKPVVPNMTENDRARNRRVVLLVME
jgi:outer membrane protein OmpA-like peptidoglycan-associated protein